MSLYRKGLLAFALVILVAVATVLLLVGRQTETRFRQYALLYSGRAQGLAAGLVSYYRERRSWEGVQTALPTIAPAIGAPQGAGHGAGGRGAGPAMHGNADAWGFRVADAQGHVVADAGASTSQGLSADQVSRANLAQALPLSLDGRTVGYLVPDAVAVRSFAPGGAEDQYLQQVRRALWTGAGVAFVAALLVGGVLVRGIVAPVRHLSEAAERIAQGDLEVRAEVASRDEIGQLGRAFNAMAESLARSRAVRRAQTADIAHELRNPLSVLQGTLEAMADGVYAPTPENLDPALAQVKTLTRLVEDLRVLALADAGELRLDRQRIALGALLARVAEGHRMAFEEQGLDLVEEQVPELPDVIGDADRLAQVLGNLLANALHHVPAGGEVQLSAVVGEGGVIVSVVDHGPGVAEEDLPHLFERFWRGDPSRHRDTGGSGLGLAIARHIVEGHGGRIWAEITPGGGLTVSFRLPAAETPHDRLE